MRDMLLAKKSSAAAVSSWGFSGYITVLPEDNKPSVIKTNGKEKPSEKPRCEPEPKSR
jgi:hypothetical protein